MRGIEASRFVTAALALLIGAGAPVGVAARQDDPLPSSEEILARFLQRLEERGDALILPKYSFTQSTVVESLGSNGDIKERETFSHIIVPVEGALFYRLVKKDGEPLTTREIAKEAKREREFRRRKKRERKKPKKKSDDSITVDADLLSRFDWTLGGIETLDGRRAYRLDFRPKGGKLPEKRRSDRVLNKAAGTIWFDTEETDVARVHLRLTEEVSFWGGLLGRISAFDLRVDQRRTDEGDWLPVEQTVYLRGRFFIRSVHRRTRRRATGFRRMIEHASPGPIRNP